MLSSSVPREPARAQIGLDHRGGPRHLSRQALAQSPALVQNDQSVGEPDAGVNGLLDDGDGDPRRASATSASAASELTRASSGDAPRAKAPTMTFSSTVMWGKRRITWKVRPM